MKKKILTVMLFTAIVVMMLSSCGNSVETSGNAEPSGSGEETYYQDGSLKSLVEYDADGNKTKETWYYPDGSIQFWTEYEYDADGNIAKGTCYYSDGSISE